MLLVHYTHKLCIFISYSPGKNLSGMLFCLGRVYNKVRFTTILSHPMIVTKTLFGFGFLAQFMREDSAVVVSCMINILIFIPGNYHILIHLS